MAARSIWNGTLTFGEVAIPVKLFSATQDRRIHFREVRLRDGCPVEHRLVGADSGREIRRGSTLKSYETSGGKQVILTDEEIAAARGPRPKVIELEHFVAVEEIDPVFYDKPYVVGAQAGGERAYRVLLAALEQAEKVGIGRFVLRTREQLVALRPRGGALVLHTMRFADEVVDPSDFDLDRVRRKPSEQEIKMASKLVEGLHADFDPSQYEDTYREEVLKVVELKAAGKNIELPEPEETEAADDLLAQLEASLSG
jgi:DNA end-binding protein Ku